MPTAGNEGPNAAVLPEHQKLRAELEKKLLAIGGERVVWRDHEPDLAELVSRGRLFTEPVRLRRGRQSACHCNSAKLWCKDIAGTTLVTGYGLSGDLLWRQHSWVVQKGALVETTELREKYFGIVLEDMQAVRFWLAAAPASEQPDPSEVDPQLLVLLEQFVERQVASEVVY